MKSKAKVYLIYSTSAVSFPHCSTQFDVEFEGVLEDNIEEIKNTAIQMATEEHGNHNYVVTSIVP